MRDLRNNMDMHLPVISDWDYGSSTSNIDDLPEVQIQIGLGAEQSLLHNTPQMSLNITSPSCNDGNNASDVTLVDAFFNNGHHTLPQDTNNSSASCNNGGNNKDLVLLIAILQVMGRQYCFC